MQKQILKIMKEGVLKFIDLTVALNLERKYIAKLDSNEEVIILIDKFIEDLHHIRRTVNILID